MSDANDINKKTLDRLEKISYNFKSLKNINKVELKDIPLEFKDKDYMVDMSASDEEVYIKKIAVTNDTKDIPIEVLQELNKDEKIKQIILTRINHIIKKILQK